MVYLGNYPSYTEVLNARVRINPKAPTDTRDGVWPERILIDDSVIVITPHPDMVEKWADRKDNMVPSWRGDLVDADHPDGWYAILTPD